MNDVHIRYEDSEADSAHPFTLGLLLDNLSAQSTDEYWVSGCGLQFCQVWPMTAILVDYIHCMYVCMTTTKVWELLWNYILYTTILAHCVPLAAAHITL